MNIIVIFFLKPGFGMGHSIIISAPIAGVMFLKRNLMILVSSVEVQTGI